MEKQKNDPRLSFKKGDIAAIAFVLLLAAAVFLITLRTYAGADGRVASIYKDGELVREVDLDKLSSDETLEINGDYHCVVEMENGRIRVADSDCPGQSCVHTGWISNPGQTVICLPNRVEIRISGSGGVDVVAGQ